MSRNKLLFLKEAFYDWCATLSLDEIVSNKKLIHIIEQIERILVADRSMQ